jgi:hypothetical protein
MQLRPRDAYVVVSRVTSHAALTLTLSHQPTECSVDSVALNPTEERVYFGPVNLSHIKCAIVELHFALDCCEALTPLWQTSALLGGSPQGGVHGAIEAAPFVHLRHFTQGGDDAGLSV